MVGNGVVFVEPPRQEAYGTVAVFLDYLGNRWDLVQLSWVVVSAALSNGGALREPGDHSSRRFVRPLDLVQWR